jgi:hypothetical protein
VRQHIMEITLGLFSAKTLYKTHISKNSISRRLCTRNMQFPSKIEITQRETEVGHSSHTPT